MEKCRLIDLLLSVKKSGNRSGIFSYVLSAPAASKTAVFAGETVGPFLTHAVSTDCKRPLHRVTAPTIICKTVISA
jgi:hypothetical protein